MAGVLVSAVESDLRYSWGSGKLIISLFEGKSGLTKSGHFLPSRSGLLASHGKERTVETANLIKLGAKKGRKRGEEREREREREENTVVHSHLDVS